MKQSCTPMRYAILLGFSTLLFFTSWQMAKSYNTFNRFPTTSTTYRNTDLPSSWRSATERAANEWTAVSSCSWTFTKSSSSGSYFRKANIDGPTGKLAVCLNYRDSNNKLSGFRITINQEYTWYTGTGNPSSSQFDLQSIVTHELGHAVGLDHTQSSHCPNSSSMATMCAGSPIGKTWQRSLSSDDKSGIRSLYP